MNKLVLKVLMILTIFFSTSSVFAYSSAGNIVLLLKSDRFITLANQMENQSNYAISSIERVCENTNNLKNADYIKNCKTYEITFKNAQGDCTYRRITLP